MWLFAGLGNPGARYEGTRHNFGFDAVDRIAREAGARFGRFSAASHLARGSLEGQPVLLVKPLTFMNRSGGALREIVEAEGLSASEVLVLFDDIALPLGAIRIRERGSSGGHLGLASIIAALGAEPPRLRLGIRPEREPEDLAEFVLQPFEPAERIVVEQVLERVVEATRTIVRDGMARAMSEYNRAPGQMANGGETPCSS